MHPQHNARDTFSHFNTHTPPDITDQTRIVAVLGIDPDTVNNNDAWYISDFFAFYHLLHDMTVSQHWLHSLDLETLLAHQDGKVFVHGDGERKVVLDEEILRDAMDPTKSIFPLQRVDPEILMKTFNEKVVEECKAAETAGGNVLVMMFGHRSTDNFGFQIGSRNALWKAKDLVLQLKESESKIPVTLFTTQYTSGGWACQPNINPAPMLSADPETRSLPFSGSCSRAFSSMYTTAITQRLTMHPHRHQPLGYEGDPEGGDECDPATWTREQLQASETFKETVYETMLKDVDKRGYEHCIIFSAQDDAWEICWGERTGFSLERYRERWERLATWPPADQSYHEELSPPGEEATAGHSTSSKRRTITGRYPNLPEGLIHELKTIGPSYLHSLPGYDHSGNSGALHHDIQQIELGYEQDLTTIQKTLAQIHYRMSVLAATDRYLEMLEIPAPEGKNCAEYDYRQAIRDVPFVYHDAVSEEVFKVGILFPSAPAPEHWQDFPKGFFYLITAFWLAGTEMEVVRRKMGDLRAYVENTDIEPLTRLLLESEEVVRKRGEVARVFKWESMTPKVVDVGEGGLEEGDAGC
ncbi:MAG: hypothetical protein Q9168_005211 [Polycauliona sp. 1 TL-2023]